ncbi:hypothetical protein [Chryseobacterium rhizosphaerae]|uniref:DUF4595 domain-containing protein n=1 Tax=Chryseobacterium rhizosphaerae TaxID=395937 RepID=A0AAE3YAC6_9FLAO|nr:hypothetical protein [Chryseobacterium rhizosphaerae]MDR6526947.1 hypothetical protein [Chryseobacterium rhizosphaerae]
MVKNYFLKIFTGVALLGVLASCNTTSDPTESIPNPDEGAVPKKVLEKISMDNVSQEEYITTAGVLNQAVFKDDNSNANYTSTLTYNTNKKITKINFASQTPGSLSYEFDVTPDINGQIYNASCVATGSLAGTSYISDYAFTYDVAGKLTKILEKRKAGGISAYNVFVENVFVYAGDNIFKVTSSKGILNINGVPDMTTAVQTVYSFQNYDSQKSPFSTLPKVFFIMRGLMNPINFYRMSPNNPTSTYIQMPAPAPGVNTIQSYTYDQGYPVIEKNQKLTYSYKNL